MVFLLLFLLVTPAASNQTSQVLRRRQTPTVLLQSYLSLPMFVDSDLSEEEDGFSPARSSAQEPLHKPVRQLLLPVRANSSPRSVSGGTVRTSCARNKMQVQVGRKVFGTGEPDTHLKLGTCAVSRSTADHVFFEYELSMCGTTRTMVSDLVVYFNVLHYEPPALRGPVRRSAPFSLPVGCYFTRYLYPYTSGHTPEVQMQKVFKETKKGSKVVLTPQTAQWEKLSPSNHFILGQQAYFEAEAPALSHNQRLYVHSCFVTSEASHTSTPQVSVVENFGCAVKRKDSVSKFIAHKSNVVRFSVDSSLLKAMTGQLYMHCNASAGSLVPTPTAKSCNYNTESNRWEELFGLNSACDCCDSTCSSAASTVTQISSGPWSVQPKGKRCPPNRQTGTPPTTMSAARPGMNRGKARSRPEQEAEVVMGKLEWPFTGGGVTWREEDGEETLVIGSAAVEAEEEMKVEEPRRIFEDVFVFGE